MRHPSKRAAAIAQAQEAYAEANERLMILSRQKPSVTENQVHAHGRAAANDESLNQETFNQKMLNHQSLVIEETQSLAQAIQALADAEALPDEYTCPQCGNDFFGPHEEMLIAAHLKYDLNEAGELMAVERFDLGMANNHVDLAEGRRMKICDSCISTWVIKPRDYFEMR